MRCNKLKPKTQFSNNKLQELKSKMRGRRTLNPETQGLIPCRACIGGAKSEIRCVACEEYKDLGGFAKSQRSKGDDAAVSD